MRSGSMAVTLVAGMGLMAMSLTGCAHNKSNKEATVLPPPPPLSSEPMPASMAASDSTATAPPAPAPAVAPEPAPAPAVAPPPAPAAAYTPAPAPAASSRVYIVKKGDTLWSIATRIYGHGNAWENIAKVNGLNNPNQIKVGQELILP